MAEFASTEDAGAQPLVGEDDNVLIPEDGDVVVYGGGGSGKTTLTVDLGCHLAAGDDWLGIRVPRKVRVGLVENEGPRALFRRKLGRKRAGWRGSEIGERLQVFTDPWGSITFADPDFRDALATWITDLDLAVVILGPVIRLGMDAAGTLQEVVSFLGLVAKVRARVGRSVAFVLVHHENRGGQVSGAWEPSCETLLHVSCEGHGKTRVHIEKARWASELHGKSLHLLWTDGEGFEIEEKPERDDATIAEEILAAVLANGGASWNMIEKQVSGRAERKRGVRRDLLAEGRLINAAANGGMKLWHADDPACPARREQVRPDRDAVGTHLGPPRGEGTAADTASLRPGLIGTQGAGTQSFAPVERARSNYEISADFEPTERP